MSTSDDPGSAPAGGSATGVLVVVILVLLILELAGAINIF